MQERCSILQVNRHVEREIVLGMGRGQSSSFRKVSTPAFSALGTIRLACAFGSLAAASSLPAQQGRPADPRPSSTSSSAKRASATAAETAPASARTSSASKFFARTSTSPYARAPTRLSSHKLANDPGRTVEHRYLTPRQGIAGSHAISWREGGSRLCRRNFLLKSEETCCTDYSGASFWLGGRRGSSTTESATRIERPTYI